MKAVIAQPEAEPVTYGQLKDWCRLDDDEERELLVPLITAAREWCEGHADRILTAARTVTLTGDRFPARCTGIDLPHGPVIDITTVQYRAEASGEMQTVDAGDYLLKHDGMRAELAVRRAATWPTTACEFGDVVITYRSGFETVPVRVQQAILMLAAHWYRHREAVGERPTQRVAMGVEALLESVREPVL